MPKVLNPKNYQLLKKPLVFRDVNEQLRQLLEQLYSFLRDQGFSTQSEVIRKLIYYIEINDVNEFKKEFKSSMIWGGAGSIKDIDLRDIDKQKELDNYIKN